LEFYSTKKRRLKLKTFFLILFLVVIPEPIIFLCYFILKKYFPEHPLTSYLEGHVKKIKLKLKKIYSFIIKEKETIVNNELAID
jgi:hypothetical protein